MQSSTGDGSDSSAGQHFFRFSTNAVPEQDRIAYWRDEFCRRVVRCDFEPLGEHFFADVTFRALADLNLMSAEHSAARAARNSTFVADGDDSFLLQIPTSAGFASQFGREVAVKPGDALLTSNADAGVYTFPSEHSRCLLIGLSRSRLRPLLHDFDAALLRPAASEAPALKLLTRYAQAWLDTPGAALELQQMAAGHIYDLVAMTFGPTRDAAEIGRLGGVRAAQLAEAKAHVMSRLADSTLSVDSVAKHLGVTPRYIHMLFEVETESFSEFVLAQRLTRAHAMLHDPRFIGMRISAIAFDNGFGDLSYFNRTFRRRFQMTPSAARSKDGPQ